MRLKIAQWYPADATNYTQGRRGESIKFFTVHHTAANNTTLRYLWADPARNGSSHFGVFKGYVEQYVDTDNTAWTNGNWTSNLQSITAEVTGDWRFGYYDQSTLDSLTDLMYECLKVYPDLELAYHKDVSDETTLCPADLKDKGYAQECWNKAKSRLEIDAKPGVRTDIQDKKVITTKDTDIWDMNFSSWSDAKSVGSIKAGTVIDIAGEYDHPLSSSDYYISKWSWDRGLDYGINKADCKDYENHVVIVPPDTPDVDDPSTKPPVNPDEGQGVDEPTDSEKIDLILEIVRKIWDIISSIFKRN